MIYPILAIAAYGWQMSGSDINPEALKWAKESHIPNNELLKQNFSEDLASADKATNSLRL